MEPGRSARVWLASGAMCCALAVSAGAFGAHALEGWVEQGRLAERALLQWRTAASYAMYGGLGLLAVGLLAGQRRSPDAPSAVLLPLRWAGRSMLSGTLIFSFSVGALALGAPRMLGAVAPIGGLLLIVGFVLLSLAALRAG